MRKWIGILVTLCCGLAFAQQDPAPVKKAIESWLAQQTKGLPGRVSFEIRGIDAGNQLVPCASFEVSRPAGGMPWGKTNVSVRCLGEAGWRISLPVHIRVMADYLVSARTIPQGMVISADDLTTQSGDLSELPASILVEPAVAIGKVASTSIPLGRPLRTDMLKTRNAVQQGQTVKVISRGPGFAVANEGQALNSAQEGQVAKVRLNSGQVVSGIAKAGGSVEVGY